MKVVHFKMLSSCRSLVMTSVLLVSVLNFFSQKMLLHSTYCVFCLVQGVADQVREAASRQRVCLSARPETAGPRIRVPSPPGQLGHVQAHPRGERLVGQQEQEQEACVWEQKQCQGAWSTAAVCGDSLWVHSNNTSTLIVEKTNV